MKNWKFSRNYLRVNKRKYDLGIKTAQIIGSDKEIVLDSFSVTTPLGGKIVVPKGFVSDLASTPRITWSLIPPTGKYKTSAIVHDWLYYSGLVSQKQSDDIFLYLMRSHKVDPVKRCVMWLGVRLFGFLAYKKHRKQDKNQLKKFLIRRAFKK